MKTSDAKIGTELTLSGGGKYRVTKINGNEISLESVKIVAGMNIQLEDLPVIFGGVSED